MTNLIVIKQMGTFSTSHTHAKQSLECFQGRGAPELTVLHVVWAPGIRLHPHDHRMWAAIGLYAGREDNSFYRRPDVVALSPGVRRQGAGSRSCLAARDDTIHAVANPKQYLTGAIHVYGGDFVDQPRSQWGPGPIEERPYDLDDTRRQFAEANEVWRASSA